MGLAGWSHPLKSFLRYLFPSCCVILSPWDGQVVHKHTSSPIHCLLCGICRSPMVCYIIILSIYQFPPINTSSIVIRRQCGELPRYACLPTIHINSPPIIHHILTCMQGRMHVFSIVECWLICGINEQEHVHCKLLYTLHFDWMIPSLDCLWSSPLIDPLTHMSVHYFFVQFST